MSVNRLTLVHLTVVGIGREPASIDFDPGLTVIYGASETGKSYIEDSIDYLLGASKLRPIPEAEGYSRILLGLRTDDDHALTLVRGIGETTIDVYARDLRDVPTERPDASLQFKHNNKSKYNISRSLFTVVGVDGRRILRNSRGDVRLLNFRDLARLAVIDDSRMAGKRSPVLTSALPQNETGEKAVFKLLLSGQDEPAGPTGPSPTEKKIGKGRVDLLDDLIDETRERLSIPAPRAEVQAQLDRLEATIADTTTATGELIDSRTQLLQQRSDVGTRNSEARLRAHEVAVLLARFGLLQQQYESDLERLRMVGEAGNLLGYFQTGTCVFCGAQPEHQHPGHSLTETTQLAAAVAAETRKTTNLHSDLISTIDDLRAQAEHLDSEGRAGMEEAAGIDEALVVLGRRLEHFSADVAELAATRARLVNELAIHAQIEQLEEKKASLSSHPPAQPAVRPDAIPAVDTAAFEQALRETLQAWKVAGGNRVSYDPTSAEVTVDGRPRASRGRGMRSIVHAAFTVALARRTIDRELIHPGFVVLDSPVVTFRQADQPPGSANQDQQENEEFMSADVVEAFYRDLVRHPRGQTIVIENGTPPSGISDRAAVYAFSVDGSTRQGFFPARG